MNQRSVRRKIKTKQKKTKKKTKKNTNFLPEIIFLGVFVVDSGDCPDDLHISAYSTAERSELKSFVRPLCLSPASDRCRLRIHWFVAEKRKRKRNVGGSVRRTSTPMTNRRREVLRRWRRLGRTHPTRKWRASIPEALIYLRAGSTRGVSPKTPLSR